MCSPKLTQMNKPNADLKPKNRYLIIFVFTSILCVIGIVLFMVPAFFSQIHASRESGCRHNLRKLASAVLLYAEDYDQTLPDGKMWVDQTAHYLKSERPTIYNCPEMPKAKYSYAYHQILCGKSFFKIISPDTTPMLFDSVTQTKNATDLFTSLPKMGRHSGRNLIAFTDGHVSPKRMR